MATIRLNNPHSVLAALETRPSAVLEVVIPPGGSDAWAQVALKAKERGVRIQSGSRSDDKGNRTTKSPSRSEEGGRSSFASGLINEREGITTEELFANAQKKAGVKGVWLALDSLQDPHNVGAIFRAAAFFGIQGILVTAERSAPLTATVYDVSTGGVEYVPFTMQINLQRAFEVAKEAGLWILGATEHEGDALEKIQPDRPWLVVLGNEEKGMRRLTQESCDLLCRIPAQGKVTSLNVATAGAVLMARLTR